MPEPTDDEDLQPEGEEPVDEELEQSFPASDPPGDWAGG
jgi:hypothetical protein